MNKGECPEGAVMAIDHNDTEERQAHLDAMIEEFRAAQQRRLMKARIALSNRTEGAQLGMAYGEAAPPDKVR
jgi:hypothetical protein